MSRIAEEGKWTVRLTRNRYYRFVVRDPVHVPFTATTIFLSLRLVRIKSGVLAPVLPLGWYVGEVAAFTSK